MRKTLQSATKLFVGMALCWQTAFSVTNSIKITEESGTTTANYPIQIGRPFLKGEITNYPQAVINGTPVTTQADVKQRYSDGSVKHAIITFHIPSLQANSSVNVTFQDQATGNNTGYLDASGMNGAGFDFDAVIELTNGVTKSASARTMIQNGDYSYWMKGSVATSIIATDHSANRTYDIGFDSYKPFRPIFHATFFPLTNQVRVRFIGEVSNSEELEDVVYDLELKMGNTSPATVYTNDTLENGYDTHVGTHIMGSRWTKEFWLGGTPSTISIDNNFNYLKETMFVPNYDSTKSISGAKLAYDYSQWLLLDKDLYDKGSINYKAMAVGGAHSEIGPLPSWTVKWLYSGDYRAKEEAFNAADLSAAWPINFRECDPTKLYLRNNGSVYGLGKPISITDRPTTAFAAGLNYSYTDPDDRMDVVGPRIDQTYNWGPDCAHMCDYNSPQYTLTGDFWYLEQMMFWTSWSTAYFNGAATTQDWGRGPTGAEGGITGNIREVAWPLRIRTLTTFLMPDSMAHEKEYYSTLMDDLISYMEGEKNITGTQYTNNAVWTWANNMRYLPQLPMGLPPLHQWERGNSAFAQPDYGIDTAVTKEGISAFECNYMSFALGRAKEMGFKTDSLLAFMARSYTNRLNDPAFNPYLLGNGRIPTVKKNGQYFATMAELKTGYQTAWQNATSFNKYDPEQYCFLVQTAVSYMYCEPGGTEAWAFLDTAVRTSAILNSDPKWAIVPRICPVVTTVANNVNSEPIVKVYPNPSTGMFMLQASQFNAAATIEVVNMLGELVYANTIHKFNGNHTINLEKLNRGIYMVRVVSGKDHYETKVTLTE